MRRCIMDSILIFNFDESTKNITVKQVEIRTSNAQFT